MRSGSPLVPLRTRLRNRSTFTCISLTIALPIIALLINEWLRPQLEPSFEPILTAAVAGVCWFCGRYFGAAALVVSSVIFEYFFLAPYYTFDLAGVNEALRFGFFVAVNGLIIALMSNLYDAEAAVLRSDRMYRNLSELLPFGGWIADEDGNMQHVAESFRRTFDCTMEQCAGLGWTSLIVEEEREKVITEWKACVAKGYFWDFEYRMKNPRGELYTVLSRGVPVADPHGGRLSWIGMCLDVTERERNLQERLRQARDIARFNAELDQLAYVSAHDLQEPLRTIASYLQLLQRRYQGHLDADADQFINYAVDGANHLRQLLQDLMRLQTVGKSPRAKDRHELRGLVDRAIANLAPLPDDTHIEFGDLPTLYCHNLEFIQLFEQLIANAVKYKRPGVPCHIRIAAERGPGFVSIYVRDNGVGIAPEFRSRIFDVFQRLHSRSEYPGTGIGLAICRKIVESHGGRIWVENGENGGACFCFTVPDVASGADDTHKLKA